MTAYSDRLWDHLYPHVHINHPPTANLNWLFSQIKARAPTWAFQSTLLVPVHYIWNDVEQHKLTMWFLYCVDVWAFSFTLMTRKAAFTHFNHFHRVVNLKGQRRLSIDNRVKLLASEINSFTSSAAQDLNLDFVYDPISPTHNPIDGFEALTIPRKFSLKRRSTKNLIRYSPGLK